MIKVKQIEDLTVTIQKAEENAKRYADENFEPIINKKSAFNKDFGTTAGTIAEGNHSHGNASQVKEGFMTAEDKRKLDGIEEGATNYVHPEGNGNFHLPITNADNRGDFLKVDTVSGKAEWTSVTFDDVQNLPTTLEGYGITNAASKVDTENRFLAIETEIRTEDIIADSDVDSIINFIIQGRNE